ncbi:hypothetical protein ACIHCV_41745 [Streptomyces sp. NPDC051956]|uniref:hypothetical protein n=1 Tax=Streptomyces sp. NPDC051956 TaxID=3365677 RepID=UPI0037CFB566
MGLDTEWALVCATPANGALVRGWIEKAGVAAAGDLSQELRELVAYLAARRDAAFSDQWLITLLDRAAGEGQQAQLAARVIVQAMVPGMVHLAQSLLTPRRDFDDVAQVVVGCLSGPSDWGAPRCISSPATSCSTTTTPTASASPASTSPGKAPSSTGTSTSSWDCAGRACPCPT